jgi:hypothetical protein
MNLYFSHKIASNQIAAKTSEGLIALGLQFLPLAVIMGRSLWLYSSDLILISALSLTAFFLLRQSSLYLKNSKFFTGLINLLSVISVLAMLFTTSIALFDSRLIAESIVIPVAVFISVLMMIDLGRRNQNTNLYYILAAVIILISLIANQVLFENFVASFMSSLFGAGILIASYKLKQRKLMIQGVILIGVGLGHQLLTLVQQFDLTSWSAMALFGMLAIVIASTIESKSSKIKSRLESLKSAYKDWQ